MYTKNVALWNLSVIYLKANIILHYFNMNNKKQNIAVNVLQALICLFYNGNRYNCQTHVTTNTPNQSQVNTK